MFEFYALKNSTYSEFPDIDIKRRELSDMDKKYNDEYKKECITRWYLKYRGYLISIYRDECDALGMVGEPYFELYVIKAPGNLNFEYDTTMRFMEYNQDEMAAFIKDFLRQIDDEIESHPEYYI
jgi:hypothetical protein